MIIPDKVKSNVVKDFFDNGYLDHADLFINELPIEDKHKKVLISMYATPDPNKLTAHNMGISERHFYKLAEQARICAYDGLFHFIRGYFNCHFNTEQNHSKHHV